MAASKLALALILGTAAAYAQQQSPAPEAKDPPMSERQAERSARQERLIACNRQAREAGLRSAERQQFIRDCLKKDNAAVGSGQQK